MKKIFNNKGFTLIEMMIVIAIAAVVLAPLTLLMVSSLRNASDVQRNIDADQSTQQSFIVLNEAIRGSNDPILINDYHGHGEGLHVGTRVFLLKGRNFVYQTYDVVSEQINTEHVLNTFVTQVDFSITNRVLEVILYIDKDGDGTAEDVFPYKFSVRE